MGIVNSGALSTVQTCQKSDSQKEKTVVLEQNGTIYWFVNNVSSTFAIIAMQ